MKLNKTLALSTIAMLMVVVLFVQPSMVDLPPKAYKAADWTREKVNAFLSKYNPGYDRKRADGSLLAKKVQEYGNSAKNLNTHYFGGKVDTFINTVKIRLEQQHDLSKQELDDLINTIQRSLRQLELKGKLTGDSVGQAIDTLQYEMAHKESITEAFWHSIKNDVGSHFIHSFRHPSLLHNGKLERYIHAYKVLLFDYIAGIVDQCKNGASTSYAYCCHTVETAKSILEVWINSLRTRLL